MLWDGNCVTQGSSSKGCNKTHAVACSAHLVMEALLVADDLECFVGARLVVQHLEHLAKAALAQHALHLIAVGDVVADHHLVVAPLVVIAVVGFLQVRVALDLLHISLAQEPNLQVSTAGQ